MMFEHRSKNKIALLIIFIILLLALITGLFVLNKNKNNQISNSNNTGGNSQQSQVIKATFSDGKINVDALFYDHKVTFTHPDLGTMNLSQAISASGARYANSDESVVFWNKGNSVTITKDGNVIFTGSTDTKSSSQDSNLKTEKDEKTGATFQYPSDLGVKYISTVDWPPKLQVLDQQFSCTEGGSEIAVAGKTEKMTIGGSDYCVTKESEGAAGSVYTMYAYAFPEGNKTAILTFTLRFVQCYNYDNPQQTECLNERGSFDVDSVADDIAKSLKF